MSISLPVHVPDPTFGPGSTIAGHLVSRDTTHLLHNTHRGLSLYEIGHSGTVHKLQEFLTKGTTSIHLIPALADGGLDGFVMVGDLVDWYSIQEKGIDAVHDFVCLESQEQLMRYCRTVPYTFVCLDPELKEFVETRRSFFAEDLSPTMLLHTLPSGESVCVTCTSNGLIGVMGITNTTRPDAYYRVRGLQNGTHKYSSLSPSHIGALVELNDIFCLHFLQLDDVGTLTLSVTYSMNDAPLAVGPVPSSYNNTACILFSGRIEFVDPTAPGGPKCLQTVVLPVCLDNAQLAPQLSEPDVVVFSTSKYIVRVTKVGYVELLVVPKTDSRLCGGNLYTSGPDLVQFRKYNESMQPGWIINASTATVQRAQFPFSYELGIISARSCEPTKRELSSWSQHFDKSLGSSFLTTKDGATYAVCRKSGRRGHIEDVIQLWLHNDIIVTTTMMETMTFQYYGTPRLNLVRMALPKGMDPGRTYAFKDDVQVTAESIIYLDSGEKFLIPSRCKPITDATCIDKSTVLLASEFSTFVIKNGNVVSEQHFDEPVMKVVANGGTTAIMTLQRVYIDYGNNQHRVFEVPDRLSDVVIANGEVVGATFQGLVYSNLKYMCKLAVDNTPAKLIVALDKVLAVTEVDAAIIDTAHGRAYSAVALSGCNGGFPSDNESFALLKNGNMWVCDLGKLTVDLGKQSQMFIGPIKAEADAAPQWSWAEKLMCTNSLNVARFDHEITDVCPIHPLQSETIQTFDGLIASIQPKAYISSFETLYLWADFKDFDLFKRLVNVQKRLETNEHTLGGHSASDALQWRGFVDGELLRVALTNHNVDWIFEEEGISADSLRSAFEILSF